MVFNHDFTSLKELVREKVYIEGSVSYQELRWLPVYIPDGKSFRLRFSISKLGNCQLIEKKNLSGDRMYLSTKGSWFDTSIIQVLINSVDGKVTPHDGFVNIYYTEVFHDSGSGFIERRMEDNFICIWAVSFEKNEKEEFFTLTEMLQASFRLDVNSYNMIKLCRPNADLINITAFRNRESLASSEIAGYNPFTQFVPKLNYYKANLYNVLYIPECSSFINDWRFWYLAKDKEMSRAI